MMIVVFFSYFFLLLTFLFPRDPEAEALRTLEFDAASWCLFMDLLLKFREYHEEHPYDTSVKAVIEMLVKKLNYTKAGEREDARTSTHMEGSCFICSSDVPPHELKAREARALSTTTTTTTVTTTTTSADPPPPLPPSSHNPNNNNNNNCCVDDKPKRKRDEFEDEEEL